MHVSTAVIANILHPCSLQCSERNVFHHRFSKGLGSSTQRHVHKSNACNTRAAKAARITLRRSLCATMIVPAAQHQRGGAPNTRDAKWKYAGRNRNAASSAAQNRNQIVQLCTSSNMSPYHDQWLASVVARTSVLAPPSYYVWTLKRTVNKNVSVTLNFCFLLKTKYKKNRTKKNKNEYAYLREKNEIKQNKID